MRRLSTRQGARLRNERGLALVSALLILAAVSLIAVGMSGDTTTALKVTGNRKQQQQSFQLADGGADLGTQILLDHLYYDAADPANEYPGSNAVIPLVPGKLSLTDFQMDANIESDIQGYPGNDNAADPGNGLPDVTFTLVSASPSVPMPDTRLTLDIDRLRASILAGSSIEFASGYEGIGKGAAAGSVAIYYLVDSLAAPSDRETINSDVSVVYRKVSQILGGGEN